MTTRRAALLLAAAAAASCNQRFEVGVVESHPRLDPSFGRGGVATVASGGVEPLDLAAHALAIQPDGRIVAVGTGGSAANRDFLAVRLTDSGSLDSSFGQAGLVTVDFGAPADLAQAVRVLESGELLIAGESRDPAAAVEFAAALVRLRANGTVDPDFGPRRLDAVGDNELVNDLAVLPSGAIRLAGHGRASSSDANELLVYGLRPEGAVDPSFAQAAVRIGFFGGDDFGTSLVVDAQNRLVVAGSARRDSTDADFALARLLPDGTLDSTFQDGHGFAGRVATDFFAAEDRCIGLALQPDGKLVCAGLATRSGATDFALARYLPSGALDESFGHGGKVVMDLGGADSASAVLVLADGRILAGGQAQSARGDADFALLELNADGSPAENFGVRGAAAFDLGSGRDDGIHSMALDSEGRVLLLGHVSDGSTSNLAVARLSP